MEEKDPSSKASSESNEEETVNVGIVAMECYFPKLYIAQSEYEQFNNISEGKYTIGLGQTDMAFTSDREDIVSICLTVLSNLLRKNDICYSDIGWICVATETIIDHSKSISSSLQQLFADKGNSSIEGIDVKHACYGGTFALFTAFDRINSKYWDGKYCIVISADIAEYAPGPARCTGGCGAVAILLGHNACIDLNLLRSSYKADEYDFYKPHLNSAYPVVNGHVSNKCYLTAFDACYNRYAQQMGADWTPCNTANYWLYHAPYNKLVTKTCGRVIYHDFLRNAAFYFEKYKNNAEMLAFLTKYEKVACADTVDCRLVIKRFEKIAKQYYEESVAKSTVIPKSVGNCYTASIFLGLISLIYECRMDVDGLLGKDITMFSYGSGTVASLYSLKVVNSANSARLLRTIIGNNDIEERFAQRRKMSCVKFTDIMNEKEKVMHANYECKEEFVPLFPVCKENFYEGTYFLSRIDAAKQRFYEKFECEAKEEKASQNENGLLGFCEQMSASAQVLLKKVGVNDGGIGKQGAIQIDKIIFKTRDVEKRCSNS